MKKKEKIMEQIIELLEDNENIFADAVEELDNKMDFLGSSRWRDMDEFDDEFCSVCPLEIAEAVLGSYHFDTNDYFFRFKDGYELESADDRDYSDEYDADRLAEDLADNLDDLDLDSELTELLQKYNDTDEDEEYDETLYKLVYIVKTTDGEVERKSIVIGDEMRNHLKEIVNKTFACHGEELKKIISISEFDPSAENKTA